MHQALSQLCGSSSLPRRHSEWCPNLPAIDNEGGQLNPRPGSIMVIDEADADPTAGQGST
jgi:hypothetical protein